MCGAPFAIGAVGIPSHDAGQPARRCRRAEHRGETFVLDGPLAWPLLGPLLADPSERRGPPGRTSSGGPTGGLHDRGRLPPYPGAQLLAVGDGWVLRGVHHETSSCQLA